VEATITMDRKGGGVVGMMVRQEGSCTQGRGEGQIRFWKAVSAYELLEFLMWSSSSVPQPHALDNVKCLRKSISAFLRKRRTQCTGT
jgi:hypothetical protein